MKCPKCGEIHPTEDETGDRPGSAVRVERCPTDVKLIMIAEAKVRSLEMAMHKAIVAHAEAVSELNARRKAFAKTL
jgi:hypothetical protein